MSRDSTRTSSRPGKFRPSAKVMPMMTSAPRKSPRLIGTMLAVAPVPLEYSYRVKLLR
ncbi:hypothetical protein D3C75_715560 [compost metagenome]